MASSSSCSSKEKGRFWYCFTAFQKGRTRGATSYPRSRPRAIASSHRTSAVTAAATSPLPSRLTSKSSSPPPARGSGGSGKPAAIEAYDQVELAADVVGLIDALGEERAIVIGHDWGASVAWNTALMHPERVRAVVGMSVPYGGRSRRAPLGRLRELFKDYFFYVLYFQEPGVAEAELEADVRASLRAFYFSASAAGAAERKRGFVPQEKVTTLSQAMMDGDCGTWLSDADLDHFTAQF